MKVWSVLIAILVFGLLVLTHELGHYIAARACHVRVREFSIGFGPRLIWYTSKKTGIKYSLAMIPFGGFVSMDGEEGASNDPDALNAKPAWQRMIIMAAGGLVNLITGFILMFALVLTSVPGSTVVARHTGEEGSGSAAVLQQGDEILSVAGRRVHTAQELSYAVMRYGVKEVDVVVLRGGEEMTLRVSFPVQEESGQKIGVCDFIVYAAQKNFGNVMKYTFYQSVNTVRMVWESLYDLITGRFTMDALSGPVGITGAISDAVSGAGGFRQGAIAVLYFASIIAINLGVVNLFPLPALDGGRILCLLIGIIIRRPIPEKVEATIHGVGMALLFGLLIFITVKDVIGLIPRS